MEPSRNFEKGSRKFPCAPDFDIFRDSIRRKDLWKVMRQPRSCIAPLEKMPKFGWQPASKFCVQLFDFSICCHLSSFRLTHH